VDDREDIGSVMLSAFSNLLEKYAIDPNSIGRVEVGTETLIDKSKSIKTTLMQLLGDNTDVEGVSSTNACYGGTAALLNSVAWVQSEDWDGRYAVVICGDIAVYETGPGVVCGSARATQGCGVVAMLIGADAPLVLEAKMRHSHVMDVYDFYKPHHSEYAEVDGACSQNCYLRSVDSCFNGLKGKALKLSGEKLSVGSFDYYCFHSPYNKLVQKGFGRLVYSDLSNDKETDAAQLADISSVSYEQSLEDKALDAHVRKLGAEAFTNKMSASSKASIEVGNCYTGAVFVNLLSLICFSEDEMLNKRIGMFSYGSGSVATLYSLKTRQTTSPFSINRIKEVVNLQARLADRSGTSVEEFSNAMELRAQRYGQCDYEPTGAIANIAPGAYYLSSVNNKHHRTYVRAV
jgi:hydroxymethylglutaryl-CoA synthase